MKHCARISVHMHGPSTPLTLLVRDTIAPRALRIVLPGRGSVSHDFVSLSPSGASGLLRGGPEPAWQATQSFAMKCLTPPLLT